MSKSKSRSGKALFLSLVMTVSQCGTALSSAVWAQSAFASSGNWYDNAATFFDRGKRNFNSGQFDQALKDFTECIKIDAKHADFYYWRSMCFSATQLNDEAIADLDQAIRLDNHNPDFFVNRGLIYSNQNKHEAAVADFSEALKIDPSLSEARRNREYSQKELEKTKVANASAAAGVSGTTGGTTTYTSNVPSNAYKPYVGKIDAKNVGLAREQKSQRDSDARLYKEKLEVERMASERARMEERNAEVALRGKETEERIEKARALREEAEANRKLAMVKAPVVQAAIEQVPAKERRKSKTKSGAVELSPPGRTEAESDALVVVNRPVRDKWALIVGISEFKDSKLNLHYPAKDAKDFYNFLVNEGNFAKDHVRLLVNEQATRASILSELGDKWLPHVANPDDLVLIYISSHGSPSEMDVANVNYLLAYDTDTDNLLASGLPMQDLSTVIKNRVHSDRVVVVLDACHSGGAETGGKGLTRTSNVDADAVAQGTGQLVISSSSVSQVSWESKNYENSVFTRCLIDSLRKNGNATTLGDAFQSMHDKVQEEVLKERGVLQTPVLKSKWKGSDLRISVPPAAPGVGF